MKRLLFIPAFVLTVGFSYAQSEQKKDPVRPINTEVNENASKGKEISNLATTTEGGKEKGMSISSAARRNTLMRERAAAKGAENSDAGKERAGLGAENAAAGRERAAMGAENAERGRNVSNQARAGAQMKPEVPAQARPNVTVPQSRPNAPVTRPNTPAPNRPNTPPGRPNGLPGGGGL